ncbi:MAG: hypothetical protein NT092_09385 [Bacteroidia bacterium]|nr:hypothetical protein [Bacteroidia bacterium]
MKNRSLKLAVSFILVMLISCDEPETVVTDIVHTDGSVTRKIEMKNTENKFELEKIQVPFDSTWIVKDSLEISDKGDTTWVKRAEKLYGNVSEIDQAYVADSGSNRGIPRRAEFKKTFKWFNTEYHFAEIIDRKIKNGYPVSDFLNQEELKWFYSPESVVKEKTEGPDSLKYKAFEDTVKKKTDRWAYKCLVSEWSAAFLMLTEGKAGSDITKESLKAHEDDLVKLLETNEEGLDNNFDSLWTKGILLQRYLGLENGQKFMIEADSAAAISAENVLFDFKEYTVRIIMPGKLIGTNGFVDSTDIMLWPVKSDYFTTQQYEMWAESKTPNKWAWYVTGIFLLFVLAGIIFRSVRK